jgi:hypothetical protein
MGVAVNCASRAFDHTLAVFLVALDIAGSGILIVKALRSRPGRRGRIFSRGYFALLPESRQQWLLHENVARASACQRPQAPQHRS